MREMKANKQEKYEYMNEVILAMYVRKLTT